MDIENQFGNPARIPEDYRVLDTSVEFMAAFVLCWGPKWFTQQREVLTDFLNLRESSQIPWYVKIEDMKAWIISRDRSIIKERFQNDDFDRKDGLLYLIWEVNIRLKLQEIETQIVRDQRLAPLRLQLPTDQDPHLAALSDLQSGSTDTLLCAFNERLHFQQALKEITHELVYPPISHPKALPDVVVDTVDCLLQVVLDEGEAECGARGDMDWRHLSSVAICTVVTVLHEVRADVHLTLEFSRATRARVVACIHAELLKSMGSHQALQGALLSEEANSTTLIAAAVTSAIKLLYHVEDAPLPSPCVSVLEPGVEAATGLAQSVEVSSVVMEVKEVVQNGCVVDEQKGPLVNAEGDAQPEDLPQKMAKKSLLKRFFGRVWKALRRSFCCCCVPVGTNKDPSPPDPPAPPAPPTPPVCLHSPTPTSALTSPSPMSSLHYLSSTGF